HARGGQLGRSRHPAGAGGEGGEQPESGEAGGRGDRRPREGEGHRKGGLRSQRVRLSRQREDVGGQRPREGSAILGAGRRRAWPGNSSARASFSSRSFTSTG